MRMNQIQFENESDDVRLRWMKAIDFFVDQI